MTRASVLLRWILLLSAGIWLAGCKPLPEDDADDKRNPDFLKGESRKNGMDFKGAVEAFEAALIRNPRSAAAHLELGLLFEHHMNDFAAAIHHYQKHLALKPNSNVGEMLRGRIEACKLEMLKSVSLSAVPQHVQANLERLTSENTALKQQVAHLHAQLGQFTNVSAGSAPSIQTPQTASPNVPASPGSIATPLDPPVLVRVSDGSRSGVRTHTVKSGETFSSIGRLYGFAGAREVMAANPGVDASKLRQGMVINIPAGRN